MSGKPRQADAETSVAEWETQLDLAPGDPAIEKLATLSKIFGDLRRFPYEDISGHLEGSPFEYGIDYFFGKYQGKPQSVQQNATAALYQKRQGVEVWRIMKSVAFATPDKKIIVAHVRGDRKIDQFALAHALGLTEADLGSADVSSLGVEYGTVNPFVQHSTIPVSHVFDLDLIEGPEYPNDDIVFASSGDARFYVGFDVRRYLVATPGLAEKKAAITANGLGELSRIFCRRNVIVIGGDSGIDTFEFSKMILNAHRQKLEEQSAYFGDRSLVRVEAKSDPALAGSIDTALYGKQLRARVAKILTKLSQPRESGDATPIVSFSSMAMHGVASDLLRAAKGIEYVGPQEAIVQILLRLKRLNIEVVHTALLGLSSAYDKEHSAFAGTILDMALPVDENVKRQIHKFVEDCKQALPKPQDFFEICKKIFQRATRGKIETLKNKNVAIILGASELEGFAATVDTEWQDLAIIKSNDAKVIAGEAAACFDKIRVILIRPSQAVAERIAERTIGSGGRQEVEFEISASQER